MAAASVGPGVTHWEVWCLGSAIIYSLFTINSTTYTHTPTCVYICIYNVNLYTYKCNLIYT